MAFNCIISNGQQGATPLFAKCSASFIFDCSKHFLDEFLGSFNSFFYSQSLIKFYNMDQTYRMCHGLQVLLSCLTLFYLFSSLYCTIYRSPCLSECWCQCVCKPHAVFQGWVLLWFPTLRICAPGTNKFTCWLLPESST